jgi:hypothetical protein
LGEPKRSEVQKLYHSNDLTILNVIWAPRMTPRDSASDDSGSGSEEEKMSIALSHKAAKLMKLCALEGYKRLHDLLKASASDSLYPAICMTEGRDYTTELERDQKAGYCEACSLRPCSPASAAV